MVTKQNKHGYLEICLERKKYRVTYLSHIMPRMKRVTQSPHFIRPGAALKGKVVTKVEGETDAGGANGRVVGATDAVGVVDGREEGAVDSLGTVEGRSPARMVVTPPSRSRSDFFAKVSPSSGRSG